MTDATARQAAPFRPNQEVRFAVVLYGGTSLAIYINGIVQELLHLVRATAPETPLGAGGSGPHGEKFALLSEKELSGTERVYRRLGQLLSWHGTLPTEEPDEADPVTTRFVVDVLSGTSAGGLNALFLAKALANQGTLDQIRRLWITEGDMAVLLNDKGSRLPGVPEQKPPRSLVNSRRMYWKLLKALDEMDSRDEPPDSPLVDELDCWITSTDIRGLQLRLPLYDRIAHERRHKNVLHFVYGNEYSTGGRRNDFVRRNNPFLAFAGRCSSAVPFAFEPMVLKDIDDVVGLGDFASHYERRGSGHPDWRVFYPDYVREEERPLARGESREQAFAERAFGDGGYLDNKPFSWATGTLPRRHAEMPVDRRLLYLEPDPERFVPQQHDLDRPDAIENLRAATSVLPRYETIREDLERILERNREIDRLSGIAKLVDGALRGVDDAVAADGAAAWIIQPIDPDEWRQMSNRVLLEERGVQYAAYHRLKIGGVLDDLSDLVTHLLGLEAGTGETDAVRALLDEWFTRRYPEDGSGKRSHNEFLITYDLGYRMRRAKHLQRRMDELLRPDGAGATARRRVTRISRRDAVGPDLSDGLAEILLTLKASLNANFIALRTAGRELRSPDEKNRLKAIWTELAALPAISALLRSRRGREDLTELAASMLESPAVAERLDEFALRLGRGLKPVLTRGETVLDFALAAAMSDAEAAFGTDSPEALALVGLKRINEYYENYDSALYPISYGQVGEANRIEIIRISPRDATSLVDEQRDGRRKLSGTQFNHFGGFLKQAWRRNDIMWGRLDAAERLIETLLPPFESREELEQRQAPPDDLARRRLKDGLIRDAQREIVAEEYETGDRSSLVSLLAKSLVEIPREETDPGSAVARLVSNQNPDAVERALIQALDPERILDYLERDFDADRELEGAAALRMAGRATRIIGALLDGIADRYPLKRPSRWLIRLGRVAWGLGEIATPRGIPGLLARYWLTLLMLVSLLMILGGAFAGAPATTKAGWVILGASLGLRIVVWLVEDVVARGRWRVWRWIRLRARAWLRRLDYGWAKVEGYRPSGSAQESLQPRGRRVRQLAAGFGLGAPAVLVVLALIVLAGLAATEGWLHLRHDAATAVGWLPDWLEDFLRRIWPWDHPRR